MFWKVEHRLWSCQDQGSWSGSSAFSQRPGQAARPLSAPVFSVVKCEVGFDVGVSVKCFRARCLKHGRSGVGGASTGMPCSGATKEPVQWVLCHISCPKSVRDALGLWIALHNSRFQNHGAKTWKLSPSCPLVDGISCVLSQPDT